jgi:hypothetical protein
MTILELQERSDILRSKTEDGQSPSNKSKTKKTGCTSLNKDILFSVFSYMEYQVIKIPQLSKSFNYLYENNKNYIYFRILQNLNKKIDTKSAFHVYKSVIKYYGKCRIVKQNNFITGAYLTQSIDNLLYNDNNDTDPKTLLYSAKNIIKYSIQEYIGTSTDIIGKLFVLLCEYISVNPNYNNRIIILTHILNNYNIEFDRYIKYIYKPYINVLWYVYQHYHFDKNSSMVKLLVNDFFNHKDMRLFSIFDNRVDVLSIFTNNMSLNDYIEELMNNDFSYVVRDKKKRTRFLITMLETLDINLNHYPEIVKKCTNLKLLRKLYERNLIHIGVFGDLSKV